MEGKLLDHIPTLASADLSAAERWIYSAGFNVDARLRDTSRIDEELEDLAALIRADCRICILSHQGSFRDGSAGSLEHVAAYLAGRLGRRVRYTADCIGPDVERVVSRVERGTVALLGNTRFHPGEEANSPDLARIFSTYGERIAVGGFSKAHRSHASNVGVLRHRPGVAATGSVAQARALEPWTGVRAGVISVAALGGLKPEKTAVGLATLTETYDAVLVGGAVLNLLLAARGQSVGASALADGGSPPFEAARRVLDGPFADRLVFPARVITVGPTGGDIRSSPVGEAVPDHRRIVDSVPSPRALALIARLQAEGGRLLVAGPPGATRAGHRIAAEPLVGALACPRVRGMVLGGDSAVEIGSPGAVSSGGGSALTYLGHGTTAVFDALLAQRHPPGGPS